MMNYAHKKKVFFAAIIVTLLSHVNGFSQTYHPIPEQGIVWQEGVYFSALFAFPKTGLFIYYFDGDTIIASTPYKKLFSEGYLFYFDLGFHYDFPPKYYEGAFRQDTLLHKVYFMVKDSPTESLLYDFHLTVGDSLYFLQNNQNNGFGYDVNIPNPAIIEAVDSVIVDGTYRKRMLYFENYSCGNDTSAVIEGIGNTRGLLYPGLYCNSYNSEEYYKTIFCVCVNDNQIYGASDSCFHEGEVGYSSVENISDDELLLEVFYSADGSVQVQCNDLRLHDPQLVITNVLGQRIETIQMRNRNTFVLMKNQLPAGCYLLSLFDEGKILAGRKIVMR